MVRTITEGDSAYYNGFFFGYFGRIVEVTDDGIACMINNNLGRVYSDQWQWDEQNNRWWVDLRQHKPIVKSFA